MRRTTQMFVTMLTASAMLLGFGNVANAKPAATSAVTVTVSSVPTADSPQVRQITQALQSGQAVNLRTVEGSSATLTLNNGVISVGKVTGPVRVPASASSICASTLATILFGMGALAIGALAVATAGLGGATIGGILFSTEALYGLAALAGSVSGLEAFLDSKFCS